MKPPAQLLALVCAFVALLPAVRARPEGRLIAVGELAAGGSVWHSLNLEAGRRYRIEVEQLEIDLAVVVRDRAGTELLALDGPLERWGTESGLFTAPPSGQVEVEVRSAQAGV
ncbi:MAG: hypothetical protein HC897_17725, partial [Thermoanaerobaculia bacterium]|nr:hypothetical protein [Thermoanaerobaculia bacterium]